MGCMHVQARIFCLIPHTSHTLRSEAMALQFLFCGPFLFQHMPTRSILTNFPAVIRCWTVSYRTSLFMIVLRSLVNNLSYDEWLLQGWKAFSCCCGIRPHHNSFMFSTGTGVSESANEKSIKSKLSLRVMAATVWGPWVSTHVGPFPYLIRGDHRHSQRIWFSHGSYGMRGPQASRLHG